MRSSALTGVAAAVTALAVVLSGCGSDTKTATSSSSSTTASSSRGDEHLQEAEGARDHRGGDRWPEPDDRGLHQGEQHPGDRGQDGRSRRSRGQPSRARTAGSRCSPEEAPDYAYGAIVYTGPEFDADPPNIVALMSKLSGDVDPQKIIDLAPGELNNLPDYKPGNEGETSTLGDYPAYVLGGTYTRDGATRFIAQKTVVIPAADGLYVLQLNVDGPDAAGDVLGAATEKIDSDTTIG